LDFSDLEEGFLELKFLVFAIFEESFQELQFSVFEVLLFRELAIFQFLQFFQPNDCPNCIMLNYSNKL
jgi:hypothetical protein